jgi:hypothetical protein
VVVRRRIESFHETRFMLLYEAVPTMPIVKEISIRMNTLLT